MSSGRRWDGPIHKASLQGRLADVQGLLWGDFSLLESPGFNGVRPIHCCVRRGHASILRYLISQGARVDSTDNGGWTILHHVAAAAGQGEMLTHLLTEIGPPFLSINVKAADGSTPLLIALLEGRYGAVRLLLQAGADPTLANKRGQSPLSLAQASPLPTSSSCYGEALLDMAMMIQGASYQRVALLRLREGPWGQSKDHDSESASPRVEEEMGVLHELIQLTNDDIFDECLRYFDHAQAMGSNVTLSTCC